MNKPDHDKMSNEEMAALLKSNDPAKVNLALKYIYDNYRKKILRGVAASKHYLLSGQLLAEIAEDAFNEALLVFHNNVLSGKFDFQKDTDFEFYIARIVKYLYFNRYRSEMVQKKHSVLKQKPVPPERISDDVPSLNRPDGIYHITRFAISKLKPNCVELMNLQTLQNKNPDEIIEITKLKNKHSVDQQTFICREHLKKILSQEFGIEF